MYLKDMLGILESEFETPKPYGVFHLAWLFVTIAIIGLLAYKKENNNEKQLKYVLGIYGVTALILELLKQLIWSVEYDSATNAFVWDYQWYAFPFQLCTMPIYVCLICLFLKKGWLRDKLLAFLAYTTILGSIASAIIPDSLFVSEVLINVHAMWLHLGSLVVSLYLFMSKEVIPDKNSFFSAIGVFLIFVIFANMLNIAIYKSGILNGETFNMFYISPYFESTLPVFDIIYKSVPYPIFLMIYILGLSLGSSIIFGVEVLLIKKNKAKKQVRVA